jgi:OmcA/MtrC family decaheme c-type cytochrome
MSDVHMSHSMEFPYPQSIKNCATCHEGNMASVTTDANFTEKTCRTCHPVTGSAEYGTDGRALEKIWADKGVSSFHRLGLTCNDCHYTGNGVGAMTFAELHTGYDSEIYADAAGTRYSDIFTVSIDGADFDATTKVLTIDVSVTEDTVLAIAAYDADDIVPSVRVGLYGYDARQYLAVKAATEVSGAAGAWQFTADLSSYADDMAAGVYKRVEIGALPRLSTVVGEVDSHSNGESDDLWRAIDAPSRTFDLAANAFDATAIDDIVDVAGCNTCHDALATTFHNPDRSGNIRVCKMCHVPTSAGSHMEMQSRAIDSYVHAIHSFQDFDTGDIDFTDAVEAARYELHIEHVFPNFTIKNCEACHVAGMYNVPDQSKSLPSLHSAADTWNVDRNIGAVPSYVTGPASRSCGGCHRANWINEDDAGSLAAWNQHVKTFGYLVENATGVYDTVVDTIMSMF